MNTMNHMMVGRTITGMKIADDKKALLFLTTDGEVIARADGDCCSDSWIENVDEPALGYPATVVSVENCDLPGSVEDHPEYESLAVFGIKIATDRGEILIDFRNSSNGYYGGDLTWPGEYHYGGVHGQNNSTENWRELERTP
jgi:hypothetical protein